MSDILTPEERAEVQGYITEYIQQNDITPVAPSGGQGITEVTNILEEEKNPTKKESKKLRSKMRGLWQRWRNLFIDSKSLELEQTACKIQIERAETKLKLLDLKNKTIAAKDTAWIARHKGNLEEINFNTTSRPNLFWYGLKRGFFYITSLTDSVPKIIKNLFFVGGIGLVLILLKYFNVL